MGSRVCNELIRARAFRKWKEAREEIARKNGTCGLFAILASPTPLFGCTPDREFKFLVYGKREKSDSSWEFLKIEKELIKTAQSNSYGQKVAWNY